ncbi:MAG: hypothetical protein JW819_00020 [Candidatus Krumholzibacteriota bacterium]|nr:hypothetical protein [Candidatus Krumholzibacteriota bacterium]
MVRGHRCRPGMAALALLAAATLAAAGGARSAIHTVTYPGPIQSGIDLCDPGDTLLVFAGPYTGEGNRNLDYHGKDIHLLAYSGPELTVIDCAGQGRALHFHSGESRAAAVEGFTIRGGAAETGMGILCEGASPTLSNLVIENCVAGDGTHVAGGGLACTGGASPLVANVLFQGNVALRGGALHCDGSVPVLDQATFRANLAAYGGAIHCAGGAGLKLQRTVFEDNEAAAQADSLLNWCGGFGGAVYAENAVVELIACSFRDNQAHLTVPDEGGRGGALYCLGGAASLVDCDLDASTADLSGGGVFADGGAQLSLAGVTLNASAAPAGGAGLHLAGGAAAVLARCIVAFSSGADGLHAADAAATLDITCSDVFGSEGQDYGGALSDMTGQNGNLAADPLFCGASNPDNPLTLHASSPCAPLNNDCYALMGALPIGCTGSFHIHLVPGEFPDLAAAVAVAVDGDTVLVSSGIYQGANNRNIDPTGRNLIIIGAAGAGQTIIDCEGLGRAFHFHSGETRATVLRGLTITGGFGSNGGGIHCDGASPTLAEMVFAGNHATATGGAITCRNGAAPLLDKLRFLDNTSDGHGGAIACQTGAAPELADCILAGNLAVSHGGAVYCASAATVTVDETTIVSNGAEGLGGGIYLGTDAQATVAASIIALSRSGAGIHGATETSLAQMTCDDVWGNAGGGYAGTIPDQTGLEGNIAVNPRFCNESVQDYQLADISPCLPEHNTCNLRMGAEDQGCVITGAAAAPSPDRARLLPNTPNPFNPATAIRFVLPRPATATVEIVDVTGRRLRRLLDGVQLPAGTHTLDWDGRDDAGHPAAAGVYLCRLRAGGATDARKLALVK